MGIKQQSVVKNSITVGILLASSMILGFVRESSIAYFFGASRITDAYLIALIIPNIIIDTVKVSITTTFITVFTGYLTKGKLEEAWSVTNIIISVFAVFLIVLMVIGIIVSPELVHLIAPSYIGQTFSLTVQLTRILIPTILFGGLVGILVGINNSFYSFVAPSGIGLISNVTTIIGIFTFGRIFGIYGLAVGSLLGVVAQFVLQIPSARKCGFRFKMVFNLQNPGVREMLRLVVPFTLSSVVGQLALIIDRTLATGLPAGSVSVLYYANKLVMLPYAIFTGAIGTVIFPHLVKAAAMKDWNSLANGMNKAVRLLTLVLFPAAVGIFVLRIPLVQLLFQRGVFTLTQTIITSDTVPYMLGTLVFGALVSIVTSIFFALKKMLIPVITGVLAIGFKIALSLLLIGSMKERGLALADSSVHIINFTLLCLALIFVEKLHLKASLRINELMKYVGKVLISSAIMGLVLWLVYRKTYCMTDPSHLILINLIGIIAIGLFTYLVMAYLLKIDEVKGTIPKYFSKSRRKSKSSLDKVIPTDSERDL